MEGVAGMRHSYPGCPDCGSNIMMQPLNMNRRAMIPGANVLFFCVNENGCGWSEVSSLTQKECLNYYVEVTRHGGVFDINKIK
jgi:hypothetical protein